MFEVSNRSKATLVATEVHLADSWLTRLVGLLGRSGLEPGEGLLIAPSSGIHTFGMRFAIDAVFLDRSRKVKRVYHRLSPWRMTRLARGVESVLELAAGTAASSRIEVGDELEIRKRPTDAGAAADGRSTRPLGQ